jgi:hypothetical protein
MASGFGDGSLLFLVKRILLCRIRPMEKRMDDFPVSLSFQLDKGIEFILSTPRVFLITRIVE